MLPRCMAAFESAERTLKGEPPNKRASRCWLNAERREMKPMWTRSTAQRGVEAEREEGDDRRRLQTPAEREQWPDLVPVDFGGKGMAEDYDYVRGPQLVEEAREY